jgi:UDP-4-amino-4,6-dideoxy-N-acetyl-beta-L-altrosamine transaminase
VSFLPYTHQSIDDDDIAAVVDVLRGDFLTTGPAIEAFEAILSETVGAPQSVACSSGTAALHLAALALDLGPGDKAIVPSITFVATANAIRYTGAEVEFADVDPNTGLLTPETLSATLERTDNSVRAVFPVHLGGQACDMQKIGAIAKDNGLAVVEDGCHALGTISGADDAFTSVGSCTHSDMTVFSFHPAKIVTMGEGGAITTRDPLLAERLRLFRNHGITRDPKSFQTEPVPGDWYYEQLVLGFNYRASDIHCALGTSQLKKLDGFVERRIELAARYDDALSTLAPLLCPVSRPTTGRVAQHLYQVLIDFDAIGISRQSLVSDLRRKGIGTQVHYIPVTMQPYYRNGANILQLPGAESFYKRCLSLPFYFGMAEEDILRVVAEISGAFKRIDPC